MKRWFRLAALWLGLLGLTVSAVVPSASASFPGQNGKIGIMEQGWITDSDTCSTDTSNLGPVLFDNNLTNRTPINLYDGAWSVELRHRLSWSPDGQQYTFTSVFQFFLGISNLDGSSPWGPGYSHLLSIYPNSVNGNTASADDITWAPDGLRLAFSNGVGIFTMNMDGSNLQMIAAGDYTDLSWAPNSDYILFTQKSSTSFPNYSDGIDVRDRIGVIRADGLGLQFFPKASVTSFDQHPDWAPDGSKIVFASNRSQEGTNQWNEPTQIFVMVADGTNVTQLTNNYNYRYQYPTFSPDGTKIVVEREKFTAPAGSVLQILNAGTGAVTNTYTPPCNVSFSSTSWQPIAKPKVYRLANWKTHERLFTTSNIEALGAPQHYDGWVLEGPAFSIDTASDAGAVPVYRMANWKTHERLFTTSASERDYALAHYEGWVYEGIAFYATQSPSSDAMPVYRMANWKTNERLFTTSLDEANYAVAHYDGWVLEGISFYVPK